MGKILINTIFSFANNKTIHLSKLKAFIEHILTLYRTVPTFYDPERIVGKGENAGS